MATQVPAKKNTAYTFTTGLTSQANTKVFQSNPTLAVGDVKVRTDSGSLANITTLPTVVSSGKLVDVTLSASEMNGDRIQVLFSDAAGDEWCDFIYEIDTTATQIDDLATASNLTTLLNRLGAFTGTGVNTVLGFLKAIMSKAASTPSDVGGTFSATTDALEALQEDIAAINVTATVSATAVAATALSDTGKITITRYSTWSAQITGLGSIANRIALHWTIKELLTDADADAIIHVDETNGLEIVNGSTTGVTANQGSLVVDDAAAGDITLTLDEAVTAQMDATGRDLYYTVKVFRSTGVVEELTSAARCRVAVIEGGDRHLTA